MTGVWIVPYNTFAGAVTYMILRFFTNFPVGIMTVLTVAMFSDVVEDIEMRTGKRLEGTVFSFQSLVSQISVALLNGLMLQIVNAFGYDVKRMTALTDNLTRPLIESTTQSVIHGGVDYTLLLNVIFFLLTAFGAIGLLLQSVTMLFYKFDEKAQAGKLKAFRAEKARRETEELNRLMQEAERAEAAANSEGD